MTRAALLALVLLAAPGCATLGSISWSDVADALKPKPQPPVEAACVVEQGKRIEKVARSVSFDLTPAADGTSEVEPVPVWAYAGTDPSTWNGGNNIGLLSVRVKANNTTSYELKVGTVAGEAQEPDVQAPCKAGVKVSVKLELLDAGVKLTMDGREAFVAVPIAGEHTIGVGWPPQKRAGLLGAKVESIVWGEP